VSLNELSVFLTEFKKALPSVSKFVSAPPHTMLKLWKCSTRPGAKQDSLFAAYEKAPQVQIFSKTFVHDSSYRTQVTVTYKAKESACREEPHDGYSHRKNV